MTKLPPWKLKALSDPNLTDKQWTLLKLGPATLGQAFMLQALKLKYSLRD
jgi:hypothetical protein